MMLEEVEELRFGLKTQGFSEAIRDLELESKISEVNVRFYRLTDVTGEMMDDYIKSPWDKVGINTTFFKNISREKPVFETITIPGHTIRGRILYAFINESLRLQMGYSISKEDIFLKRLRDTFWQILLFVCFPFSLIIGWLMSRKAMKDIEILISVAADVSKGDLKLRMPSIHPENELSELATTFNKVLDNLQKIIIEQKSITDNIAHDLRSPLTRICCEIEVALTKPRLSEEYIDSLNSMFEEVKNLQNLINTLLDMSSMEASVLSNKKRIDFKKFLYGVVEIFQYAVEEKNIVMDVQCDENILVSVCPVNMKRALANLIDNAIKFTDKNGRINIKCNIEQNNLLISVSDNGIGIPEKNIEKIFERFYQCDISRNSQGNGLGLSLVKAIVDAHDGTISVQSNENTIFTIIIPL